MKYKKGDKVRIIADYCAHRFPIGKVVKLGEYRPDLNGWEVPINKKDLFHKVVGEEDIACLSSES